MKFDPTYDYGLSDLNQTDNVICWKFGELLKTLITLSSDSDRQHEIMGPGIVTEEMADDLDTYFTSYLDQYIASRLLNQDAVDKLNFIVNFLDERSGNNDPDFWDNTSLSTNSNWQKIRTYAQEALTSLGFADMDIKFVRTEKYETSDDGQRLLIQNTRTRLVKKNAL